VLRARAVLEHLRRAAVAYVVLLVALILTLLACYYVLKNVGYSENNRFNETVMAAQNAIDNRVNSYVDAMRGARGLFYASDSVEEEEWSGYANGIELEDRYEGMRIWATQSVSSPHRGAHSTRSSPRCTGRRVVLAPPCGREARGLSTSR
jgi:CHASE1-domain containing sensor protein